MLKKVVKFGDIPIGTFFAVKEDNGEHNYYFKTVEKEVHDDDDVYWVNAVRMKGSRMIGVLEGFCDDHIVYVGVI